MARDEFSAEAKDILAQRAGMRCSWPTCDQLTAGPREDPAKVLDVGVAAHICAAASDGPRYAAEMTRSANREAVTYFEQALTALQHLPETREMREQAIDLRFDLRTSLFQLGELQRVFGYLREAEDLARALDDRPRLGRVWVYLAHYFQVTGDHTRARDFGQRALGIGEAIGDLEIQVGAMFYLGWASLSSGDFRAADGFLLKVVQALEGDRARERCGLAGFPAAMVGWFLAESLGERGRFDEGVQHGREGIRIAEALDHPYTLVCASWGLAYLYSIKGELNEASRLLERSLALTRQYDLGVLIPHTAFLLGSSYVGLGRVAEGLQLLQESLTVLQAIGLGWFETLFWAHLGEACLLTDRLEDAQKFTERAVALARERGQRAYEGWALGLLGEVASHSDPRNAAYAEGHYREAMALADELEMRPLMAHCHLGLGKLHQRTGDRERAREHLTTATTMYRDMDMRFWLEQAEAELKALRP